jgi:uroporphyrinogen-III synthase
VSTITTSPAGQRETHTLRWGDVAETLRGRRVLVTRERPGELAAMLEARGAEVVHLPLIAVVEPVDGGAGLRDALAHLDRFDWLMVTSAAGAERVGRATAASPQVRLACVGTATAAALRVASGRTVDLVPTVQRADQLADEFIARVAGPQRVLIAQADRAASTLSSTLRHAGHDVVEVVAYRTIDVQPDADALAVIDDADAVAFASGSAVESWCRAVGGRRPPIVVAIGPATAATAARLGLGVTSVAGEHSLEGLVDELERHLIASGPPDR